jgi:hypothetical protein
MRKISPKGLIMMHLKSDQRSAASADRVHHDERAIMASPPWTQGTYRFIRYYECHHDDIRDPMHRRFPNR